MLSVTVQHQNTRLDLGAMSLSLDVNGPLGKIIYVYENKTQLG